MPEDVIKTLTLRFPTAFTQAKRAWLIWIVIALDWSLAIVQLDDLNGILIRPQLSRNKFSSILMSRIVPNLRTNSTNWKGTILQCFTRTPVHKAAKLNADCTIRRNYPRSKVWQLKDANLAIKSRLKFTKLRIQSLKSWDRCKLLSMKLILRSLKRIQRIQGIWGIFKVKRWKLARYWSNAMTSLRSLCSFCKRSYFTLKIESLKDPQSV